MLNNVIDKTKDNNNTLLVITVIIILLTIIVPLIIIILIVMLYTQWCTRNTYKIFAKESVQTHQTDEHYCIKSW